jgi:hypothetical protein
MRGAALRRHEEVKMLVELKANLYALDGGLEIHTAASC